MICEAVLGDCEDYIKTNKAYKFDLTFLDPPFNQGKEYRNHTDSMNSDKYWEWMKRISKLLYEHTSIGGAVYFMQREKNTGFVFDVLNSIGWNFQNLIIWKKKTSAVPNEKRFGQHYQIIAFFTKGNTPRVFNKLRIDPPRLITEKLERKNGVYVTDVWDDIRELTSGYFAGDEPLRFPNGERIHKQQAPIQLLTRIILSSTNIGDMVFDPFAGTGTTLVVSRQLDRNSIGIEKDPLNHSYIKERISKIRVSDNIFKFRNHYKYSQNLDKIWSISNNPNNQVLENFLDT